MSEFKRQHPAAALAKVLEIIRGNFLTILIIIFVGGGGEEARITLYWIIGTILVLLVWGVLNWMRFSYKVENGELVVFQGVFVRKQLYLGSDRIQVIDISAGLVQRLFKLVAVEVKTAGSTSKEAKLSAVSRQEAEHLKEALRPKDAEQKVEADDEESPVSFYKITTNDLLLAASTSGRFGIALSIVGTAFSQIDQVISEEAMIQFVEQNIPQSTSASLVVFSIISVLVISWLFSFLATIVTYYNFTVEVKKDELLISQGLFERKQLTIPYNRIQAIQIKEGVLRQPLGYASLVIESAGYGEDQNNSTTLFPILAKERIYEFIQQVIPEYNVQTEIEEVPKRALRRYLLRMVWISLVIILVLWTFVPNGVYSLLILIPALILGYLQYRDAGIGEEDQTLLLRFRQLSKTTAIVKRYRIQAAETKQNPFQQRLKLSNYAVTVASGTQGRSFSIREIAEDKAEHLWSWFSNNPDTEVIEEENTDMTISDKNSQSSSL